MGEMGKLLEAEEGLAMAEFHASDKELESHIREAWQLIAPAKLRQLPPAEPNFQKTSRRKTT